jgi:cysteine desulfurase/selenocysteine lyase
VISSSRLDCETLRKDFPILGKRLRNGIPLVYLDNAATTQCPRQVIDAIAEVYSHGYSNVHRGLHDLSEQATELFEVTRKRICDFIKAPSAEEIVFTHGATESINVVARSWGESELRPGDEVLLTEMEHHSNIVPWQQVANKTGATLRWIPVDGRGELALDELDQLLSDRTRLVAVTAASNVLGTINPIAEIIARSHAAGARVLVDGAQIVGHNPVDVARIGVDFFAFSAHKMLGPGGVGVLYAKRELLEAMPPFLGGGGMVREVTRDQFKAADIPAKFEAGTPPIAAAIAFRDAIDYLMRVDLAAIRDHERHLISYAHDLLTEIPGVRLLGPDPDRKTGIVTFVVNGVHPHDVAQVLNEQGIAVRAGQHCAMPLHQRLGIPASTRASVYLYNTVADVEALAAGLRNAVAILKRCAGSVRSTDVSTKRHARPESNGTYFASH